MEQALTRMWADEAETPAPRPRVAADWPLMGDIVSHRAGWPEHLIRWRRAAGEDVPGAAGRRDQDSFPKTRSR